MTPLLPMRHLYSSTEESASSDKDFASDFTSSDKVPAHSSSTEECASSDEDFAPFIDDRTKASYSSMNFNQ
jgi:hypothetical protein